MADRRRVCALVHEDGYILGKIRPFATTGDVFNVPIKCSLRDMPVTLYNRLDRDGTAFMPDVTVIRLNIVPVWSEEPKPEYGIDVEHRFRAWSGDTSITFKGYMGQVSSMREAKLIEGFEVADDLDENIRRIVSGQLAANVARDAEKPAESPLMVMAAMTLRSGRRAIDLS